MKRVLVGVLGAMILSSLWAENIGSITVFGGYNAWVSGQAMNLGETPSDIRMDAGGFAFGGEVLVGSRNRTRFGLEVAWQPLMTVSGKRPDTGETVTISWVQTPILAKVVFGGSGLYGDMGIGISFVSVHGNKFLQELMKIAFPDPALTGKFGAGYRVFLNEWIGFDIGANTTIVFGDYGLFKTLGVGASPPVWLNMMLFWQVGWRAGVSVYF